MNPTEVIFAARDLGIRLSATKDDRISYRPKSKMPGWLLEEIKANKELLLRDLLLRDALRYLAERYIEGANLSVLDASEYRINEAYSSASLEEYRAAIREFVKAGLKAYERVEREVTRLDGTEK